MTQEDKNILLKDICARLPYHVMVHYHHQYNENGKDVMYDEDRVFDYFEAETIEHTLEEPEENWPDEYWKPYLRPMSSMTEEECKELGDLPATIENVGETLPNIPYYIEVSRPEQLDWLNARHFDYRGLIEKGLALEAPKGMYSV